MHKNKKQKNKVIEDAQSETSVGTQKLQVKASRSTENKFSQMLSSK
jgi:hypothetical protein